MNPARHPHHQPPAHQPATPHQPFLARENDFALSPDLEVGNETYLASLPDKAFDVSFTVSVLDHVPAPEIALAQLLRINSKAVLLLEPWIGREGKLVRSPTPHGEMTDSTPYSYSWDYARLANQLAPDWALQHEPYPLGDSCLGQHYFMYRLTPGARSPAGRPDIEPRV